MRYTLVETMLLQPGCAIRHLNRHLARLRYSCQKLGYPFNELKLRSQLESFTAAICGYGQYKLRLLYDCDGLKSFSAEPYRLPPGELCVRLVSEPMPAFLLELFEHKFTNSPLRIFYQAFINSSALNDLVCEQTPYDYLFMNADGIITEGARSNFYIECKGQLITSPLTAGVLPGTYRAALIEQGAQVQPITGAMLQTADSFFITNALIGKQKIKLF